MIKKSIHLQNILLILLNIAALSQNAKGQQYDCNFKEPIIKIDFGNGNEETGPKLSSLKNYKKTKSACPDDGQFTFTSFTEGCFGSKWHTLSQDHTPGDANGKMMLVNASERPGTFFLYYIGGLKPGNTYEISAWLVNVCRSADGCIPTPPAISMTVETAAQNQVAKFETGFISLSSEPVWKRYYGVFTLPENIDAIVLKMDDITNGGCGNDFAIDDIMVRECVLQKPMVAEMPQPDIKTAAKEIIITKPIIKITPSPEIPINKTTAPPPAKSEVKNKPVAKPVVKIVPPVVKPIIKLTTPSLINPVVKNKPASKPIVKEALPPVLKKNNPVILKEPAKEKNAAITTVIKQNPVAIPLPKAIVNRSNPVVKEIEITATEMLINLYDNGEIDGDTVSVYHNNELIVTHAGLSEKAISFHITIDEQHPHHELVMVADNLGSIPPNTSLMVITAMDKRYEIFISSSEQKNAKVVINLKEK